MNSFRIKVRFFFILVENILLKDSQNPEDAFRVVTCPNRSGTQIEILVDKSQAFSKSHIRKFTIYVHKLLYINRLIYEEVLI